MECLYDDRARQVVRNKGVNMEDVARELAKSIDGVLCEPMLHMNELAALRKRCIDLGLI